DGPLDLASVAQRITSATQIPVHVRPDALLPLHLFQPRLGHGGQAAAASPTSASVSLRGGPQPLAQLLDRMSARLGGMWRYAHNRIEFYRTETRVFNIRALTLNATADATLGLAGSRSTHGFVSTSQTSLSTTEHDVMAVVRARIEPFLSTAGVLVAEPGA